MKRISIFMIALLFAGSLFAQSPIIGISSYKSGSSHMTGHTYVNSVRLAGGVPLIIPVTTDDAHIEAIINVIDGLIMTGGEDFDPLMWYGEEPLRANGEIAPERDEFDVKLIRAAVAKGIPVLGICRGQQLMSIAFGGSLYQDIPSQIPSSYVKHRQGDTPGYYGTHTINIEKGSILAEVTGSNKAVVNSFHHQAIKAMPAGFKVTAKSADGIIEAIERVSPLKGHADGGALIFGTQFHPEIFTNAGNPLFLGLFQKLVSEAAK